MRTLAVYKRYNQSHWASFTITTLLTKARLSLPFMEYPSTAPDSHVLLFPEEESAHIDISDSFMTADTYSCSALGLYPGDIPLLGWTHGTIGSMDFNPDNLITGTGDIGIVSTLVWPFYGTQSESETSAQIRSRGPAKFMP